MIYQHRERERTTKNQNKNNVQGYILLLYCNVHTQLCDVTAQNHIWHANDGMTVHGHHMTACKTGRGTMTGMINNRHAIYMCMTDQSGMIDSSVMNATTAAFNRIKGLVKDTAIMNLRIKSFFENRGRLGVFQEDFTLEGRISK